METRRRWGCHHVRQGAEGRFRRIATAAGTRRGISGARRRAVPRCAHLVCAIYREQFGVAPAEQHAAFRRDFRVTFAGTDGQLRMGLAEANLHIDTHDAGYDRLNAPELGGARQIWFADPGEDKPAALVGANLLHRRSNRRHPADACLRRSRHPADRERICGEPDCPDREGRGQLLAGLCGSLHGFRYRGSRLIRRDRGPTGHHIDPTQIASSELGLAARSSSEWPAPLNRNRQLVLESASGAFAAFTARDRRVGSTASHHPRRLGRNRARTHPSRRPRRPRQRRRCRPRQDQAGAGARQRECVCDRPAIPDRRRRRQPRARCIDAGWGPRRRPGRDRARDLQPGRDAARLEPADPHYIDGSRKRARSSSNSATDGTDAACPRAPTTCASTIRRGAGLGGNLPAAALSDIVKKHPAVESFFQPIAATGGDDRGARPDPPDAPGRLAAMDRAISVADYQQLAQRFQGVWHAAGFEQPQFGRSREAVRIVIVPAGGDLGGLADDIRSYLLQWPLLSRYRHRALCCAAGGNLGPRRVDSPSSIHARSRAASAPPCSRRSICACGAVQPAYRSEVTRVVENTDGVSNSDIVLFASHCPLPSPLMSRAATTPASGRCSPGTTRSSTPQTRRSSTSRRRRRRSDVRAIHLRQAPVRSPAGDLPAARRHEPPGHADHLQQLSRQSWRPPRSRARHARAALR